MIRFFNPRIDNWGDHFSASETGEIKTLTVIGEVTAKILEFNSIERLLERQGLIELGRYSV